MARPFGRFRWRADIVSGLISLAVVVVVAAILVTPARQVGLTAQQVESSDEPVSAGSLIAFESDRDGASAVYTVASDGSQLAKVTPDDGGAYTDPAWSPDRTRLAVVSDRGGSLGIDVIDVRSRSVSRLAAPETGYVAEPAWSPDGSRIAWESNGDIHVIRSDGSDERRLTSAEGRDWAPSWSPDSTSVAFVAERPVGYQIWTMRSDGSHQRQVTSDAGIHRGPSWSPDGSTIVYEWLAAAHEVPELRSVAPDGTDPQPLGVQGFEPTHSPDGARIAFLKGHEKPECCYLLEYDLWTVDADGSDEAEVTSGDASDSGPSWR